MAENNQNQFKCSGDCLNCRVSPNERKTQWQYCAAQFTYNSMRMIEALHGEVQTMQGTIEELREKITAIQNNEAEVYDPNADIPDGETSGVAAEAEETAQEGNGA